MKLARCNSHFSESPSSSTARTRKIKHLYKAGGSKRQQQQGGRNPQGSAGTTEAKGPSQWPGSPRAEPVQRTNPGSVSHPGTGGRDLALPSGKRDAHTAVLRAPALNAEHTLFGFQSIKL